MMRLRQHLHSYPSWYSWPQSKSCGNKLGFFHQSKKFFKLSGCYSQTPDKLWTPLKSHYSFERVLLTELVIQNNIITHNHQRVSIVTRLSEFSSVNNQFLETFQNSMKANDYILLSIIAYMTQIPLASFKLVQ